MGELDNLIEEQNRKSSVTSNSSETNSSALRKVSNGITIFGIVLACIAILYFFSFLSKTWHEERLYISIACLFSAVSFSFLGLIGQCLDDIRNNTKK